MLVGADLACTEHADTISIRDGFSGCSEKQVQCDVQLTVIIWEKCSVLLCSWDLKLPNASCGVQLYIFFLSRGLSSKHTFFCVGNVMSEYCCFNIQGFSPLGGGEKGKEWLQGILTPRLPPVCAAARMLDCSVSSPRTLA